MPRLRVLPLAAGHSYTILVNNALVTLSEANLRSAGALVALYERGASLGTGQVVWVDNGEVDIRDNGQPIGDTYSGYVGQPFAVPNPPAGGGAQLIVGAAAGWLLGRYQLGL